MSRPNFKSEKRKNILSYSLVIVLLIVIFTFVGTLTKIQISGNVDDNLMVKFLFQNRSTQQQVIATPSTTQASVIQTQAPSQEPSSAVPGETESSVQNEVPTASSEISPSSSKEELVAYYTVAANKVKTDAAKVIRNYEDLKSEEEYIIIQEKILEKIGKFAMDKFLVKNETPVEYASKQDIIDNFPVKKQDWASRITPDQVENAVCTQEGDYNVITLTFADDEANVNPVPGVGYGTAFNIMLEEEAVLDYPGLSISDVKITYHDGVITAKIDKNTGNLVEATYHMPIILGLTAKVLGSSYTPQIGMMFEHNYSVTY